MSATRITSQDISNDTIVNADINSSAAIDASKIADGTISSAEFQRLNGIGSQAVGISDTNTLTNKLMTGASNVVAAAYLANADKVILISGASDPSSGQVLTAQSATSAAWASSSSLATSNFVFNEVPAGAVNGSNPSFVLANTASSSGSIRVYKNGLRQRHGASDDVQMDGLTGFRFNAGNIPQTNDNIITDYMK